MITIFGLMGVAEEQSGDASLFANAVTRSWLVSTERCFGFVWVRAKDEAKAPAAKRLEKQRVMSFMLVIFRVCYHGKTALDMQVTDDHLIYEKCSSIG